ncbi:hypothetical protein DFJ74DRAFT_334250 [Hyaloraphidium curvatum]|nr:hypothetical protein DFJ74DRAFT_334250 [Hyaloraphidium curvatum]
MEQPKYPPPPYESLFSEANPFPAPGQVPAGWINTSTIPVQSSLAWSQIAAAPPPPSSVSVQRESDGDVVSYDPRLDSNAEELWRFVVQYGGEMPGLEVEIEGWDTETRYAPRSYGDNVARVEEATSAGSLPRNTQFYIIMDLSSYLPPSPLRLVDVQGRPIRAALDDYVSSKNELKELVVTKQLLWDFEELKHAIYGIVRQAGWEGLVDIRLKFVRSKVYARSSSSVSQAANNPIVQCCMVVTCLWICAAPAKAATGKKVSTLVIEYPALAPVREFYNRNYGVIRDAVERRVQQKIRAWN